MSKKEKQFRFKARVLETLPDGMFRVKVVDFMDVGNDDNLIKRLKLELDKLPYILASVSGRIRMNFIKIIPGDMVDIEMSMYDFTRARIVYRFKHS